VFFECLFKYWPDCPFQIYLGSNEATYKDSRIKPLMVGPDVDYTSNLISMVRRIPEEWIFFWMEDWPPAARVDTRRFEDWMMKAQRQGAAYLRPIAIHPFAYSCDRTQEVCPIPKGSRYRISMNVAVWNKRILLKLLKPGETAWDIERKGSRRSDDLDEQFLCPTIHSRSNPPVCHRHLIEKGRLMLEAVPFLKKEGLYNHVKGRRRQRLRSYCYSKVYFAIADIYYLMKFQFKQWLGAPESN
jgi:hypothetical protein